MTETGGNAPKVILVEGYTQTEYGIAFDDGDVDLMPDRSSCVRAISTIDAEVAKGEYDAADYAGRRVVKRVVTMVATAWEPVRDNE